MVEMNVNPAGSVPLTPPGPTELPMLPSFSDQRAHPSSWMVVSQGVGKGQEGSIHIWHISALFLMYKYVYFYLYLNIHIYRVPMLYINVSLHHFS